MSEQSGLQWQWPVETAVDDAYEARATHPATLSHECVIKCVTSPDAICATKRPSGVWVACNNTASIYSIQCSSRQRRTERSRYGHVRSRYSNNSVETLVFMKGICARAARDMQRANRRQETPTGLQQQRRLVTVPLVAAARHVRYEEEVRLLRIRLKVLGTGKARIAWKLVRSVKTAQRHI